MKRNTIPLIALLCLIVFIFIHLSVYINIESDILSYLENKYNQTFIINNKLNIDDSSNFITTYSFSPKNNKNIIFFAGIKKQTNIVPFVPPIKEKFFYDTYFEDAKRYIISKTIPNETYIVNNHQDIELLSTTIYNHMKQINLELKKLGFSTTKFTCSITLSILVKEEYKEINFYILDRTKIYDCLYTAYTNR